MNINRLEIITAEDENRWNEVLEEIGTFDFYHLPRYHRLAEIRGEGKAIMPVYREGSFTIAFPMLLREIDIIPSTDLKDATSVYGYAGPISSVADIPDDVKKRFMNTMQDFYATYGIVSAFSRLHPLIDQSQILDEYGTISKTGGTLSIDLTVPQEVQVSRYRRGHKRDIRELKEMDFVCFEAGLEYLDDFVSIYHSTMSRADADEIYFFDKSYFDYLMREMPEVVHLFVCKDGDKVISVFIGALCNNIMEGHLGGTADEYLPLAPAKLLYDAVRVWSNEAGARILHLGGGVGAKHDSLYDFKLGFGCQEHSFEVWNHVVNQALYDDLCNEACLQAGIEPNGSYFPLYRHPDLHIKQHTDLVNAR